MTSPSDKKKLILLGALFVAIGGVWFWNNRGRGSADEPAQFAAIAQSEKKKDVAAVSSALNDKDAAVAARAVEALRNIGTPEARERILSATRDQRPVVREAAITQYGESTNREQVDPLTTALQQDNDKTVRAAAAKQLGQLRSWKGLDALIRGLGDPDPFVRACSIAAIEHILGVKYQYKPDDPPEKIRAFQRQVTADMPKLRAAYEHFMKTYDQSGGKAP